MQSLLYELVRKELVRPGRSDFLGTEAFEFRHLLIRDAAYESLSKQSQGGSSRAVRRLARAHRRRSLPEYAEIVGWHLEQAHRNLSELGPLDERGDGDRAARRGPSGGRGVDGIGPWRRLGGSHAPVARARPDGLPTTRVDRMLLADLGDALLWSGRFDEAAARPRRGDRARRASRRRADTCARAALTDAAAVPGRPGQPTTRSSRQRGWRRRGTARPAATISGRLGRGASCTGPAGVSASWREFVLRRSARTSTTAARRTSTIHRTT